MEFTLEKFNELKENYLDMVVSGTKEAGGLPPHITLFGYHNDDYEKQAVIHVPIRDEFMTPEGKTKLFNVVIPDIAKDVAKKEFTIYALAWASEAWIREAKADKKIDEDWRDIPIKKEVIVINLESTVKNEFIMYDVTRVGHKVSDNGDFIDNVELTMIKQEEMTQVGGSLSGISKYFWDTKK
jgi:hypothetical protein